jgi:Xaa-Pro aminopeptidase
MRIGYFFSDEPGYYEPGQFGIRLETVLRVVNRTSELKYSGKGFGSFSGFEPVCLFPFEPKLIDFDLLNPDQINYLNAYNKKIRQDVGPELLKQGQQR